MKCNFQDCQCRYQKQMTSKEFADDDKKSIYRVKDLFRSIFFSNWTYTVQTKACEECELYDPHRVRISRGCSEPAVVIILIIILLFI